MTVGHLWLYSDKCAYCERNGLPKHVGAAVVSSELVMTLFFAGFVAVCLIYTRTPTGSDINSRKKHEQEVMYIIHEHNRLHQRNLGSCMHFYLQATRQYWHRYCCGGAAAQKHNKILCDVFTYVFESSGGKTRKYIFLIHSNQKCSAIASTCAVIVFLFLWSQISIKNLHGVICHPLTLCLYLLMSFPPSICCCAQHGSLTVTIWIRSSYHSASVHHVSLLSLVTLATCIIIISLSRFFISNFIYPYVIPGMIHNTGPLINSLSVCLSVCVSSGHSVYQRSARWQQLCLDGWHLHSMVSCSWLWGREEECLREKHVCVLAM